MGGEGLCRACLRPGAPLRCMLGTPALARLYTACTRLPVRENDRLSSKLCSSCLDHLTNAHNFTKQCEKNEENFRKMYTNADDEEVSVSIKIEPDDLTFVHKGKAHDSKCNMGNEPPAKKIKLFNFDSNDEHNNENFNVGKNIQNTIIENGNNDMEIKNELDKIDNDSDVEPLSAYVNNKYDNSEYGNQHTNVENDPDQKSQEEYQITDFKHTCNVCQKTFSKRSGLTRHMINHDPSLKPFECGDCFRRFKRKDLLVRHSAIHVVGINLNDSFESKEEKVSERYSCDQCSMEFTSKNGHSSHMKIHKTKGKSSKKLHQCTECGKAFPVKGHLNRHLKIHSKVMQFKCNLCEKQFSRQDQLVSHVNKHNNVKPNICPVCTKAFAQICNLKDHLRIHTGETPFLCSICGKAFNSGSNLRQHIQRHTGITPFACNLCPKKFISKGELTCHITSHSGDHPYVCDTCGHSFTKPNSLKKHKRIHLGIKPFACDVCCMKFAYKDLLKRHYRIHTGEKPYKCTYCDRSFIQSNDLVKHLRYHIGDNIYECKLCNEKFRLQSDLKLHYPTHYIKTDTDSEDSRANNESVKIEPLITITTLEGKIPKIENDLLANE